MRFALAILALSFASTSAAAQNNEDASGPPSATPLFFDFGLVPMVVVGTGDQERNSMALSLGVLWLPADRVRGWRLGMSLTSIGECSDACQPITSPEVERRFFNVYTLERLYRRQRGRFVRSLDVGAGVATLSTTIARDGGGSVDRSGSFSGFGAAAVARYSEAWQYHFQRRPVEIVLGVGGTLVAGVPTESGPLPASGDVRTRRRVLGVGSIYLGFRVGLLPALF